MQLVEISSLQDPRLADYTQLTDVQLRSMREPAEGLFLAESTKVISRALAAGMRPRSVLLLPEWLPQVAPLLEEHPDTPVFVGSSTQLEQLTGFHMHRGALAAMERPAPRDPRQLIASAKRLVVLEGLTDHTNVGAIFRSIAALGADGVLLTENCADPLYRRAIRVSMGAVLQVPWARIPRWQVSGPMLRDAGFAVAALALRDDAINLADFARALPEKFALVFGSEGPGLSRQALASATHCVTIPMQHGVDSLNVATAAAITLWACLQSGLAAGDAGANG